jgi:hypothetical protein
VGTFDRLRAMFGFSPVSGFPAPNLSSPWSTGTGLSPLLAQDLGYGTAGTPATVHEALACPPIYRGIAALSTLVSQLHFTYDDGSDLSKDDAWMNEGVGSITPGQRLAATIQDLILSRDSVLWVQREGGRITQAVKLPRDLWGLDWMGNVIINGKTPPDQSQFIYFQSLMPLGLCEAAAETIRHFHDLRATIRARGKNPIPLLEIQVTEDWYGSDAELADAQKKWSDARMAEFGAVGITPRGLKLVAHTGGSAEDMLIAARNAVRLDFANFLNLAASLLEGANGASGTYENTLQAKDELITLSLEMWLKPLEQRMSMLTTSGKPIVLDTAPLTASAVVPARGNIGTATAPQGELNA